MICSERKISISTSLKAVFTKIVFFLILIDMLPFDEIVTHQMKK